MGGPDITRGLMRMHGLASEHSSGCQRTGFRGQGGEHELAVLGRYDLYALVVEQLGMHVAIA